ncbi:MAG: hypothetical protein ACYSW8_30810 [Planctomycetota bacterium]|jgi:hypothetical protein
MATYILNIQGRGLELDQPAMDDLCILLTTYHGRVATEVGESGDMEKSSRLGGLLTDIQAVYDDLPFER